MKDIRLENQLTVIDYQFAGANDHTYVAALTDFTGGQLPTSAEIKTVTHCHAGVHCAEKGTLKFPAGYEAAILTVMDVRSRQGQPGFNDMISMQVWDPFTFASLDAWYETTGDGGNNVFWGALALCSAGFMGNWSDRWVETPEDRTLFASMIAKREYAARIGVVAGTAFATSQAWALAGRAGVLAGPTVLRGLAKILNWAVGLRATSGDEFPTAESHIRVASMNDSRVISTAAALVTSTSSVPSWKELIPEPSVLMAFAGYISLTKDYEGKALCDRHQ